MTAIAIKGPEFVTATLQGWIAGFAAECVHIEPGNVWGWMRGCAQRQLRDELMNVELLRTLPKAKIEHERWCEITVRLLSALGERPPAPGSISWPPSPSSLPISQPTSILPLAEIPRLSLS